MAGRLLDTNIWQWTELSGYGDLPPPHDFVVGTVVGNRRIVMHGGWDGMKWLSDVYIWIQCHLNECSYLLQGHHHHLFVAIQILWLRSVFLLWLKCIVI